MSKHKRHVPRMVTPAAEANSGEGMISMEITDNPVIKFADPYHSEEISFIMYGNTTDTASMNKYMNEYVAATGADLLLIQCTGPGRFLFVWEK